MIKPSLARLFFSELSMSEFLIIFDCDGVLVDTEIATAKILSEMATENGLEMSVEEADRLFTGGHLISAQKIIEEKLGREITTDFIEDFRKRQWDLFEKGVDLIDGVEDLLKSLPYRKVVCSNGPQKKMFQTLGYTGLKNYFEEIYSGYDIECWKPDPGLFLHAASKAGVSPEKCIVIEDSKNGFEAARAAGMHLIKFSHDDGIDGALTEAYTNRLSEVLGIIESIVKSAS
jgi:HAD superfamily hydrolase (TIGR01509 family)